MLSHMISCKPSCPANAARRRVPAPGAKTRKETAHSVMNMIVVDIRCKDIGSLCIHHASGVYTRQRLSDNSVKTELRWGSLVFLAGSDCDW